MEKAMKAEQFDIFINKVSKVVEKDPRELLTTVNAVEFNTKGRVRKIRCFLSDSEKQSTSVDIHFSEYESEFSIRFTDRETFDVSDQMKIISVHSLSPSYRKWRSVCKILEKQNDKLLKEYKKKKELSKLNKLDEAILKCFPEEMEKALFGDD